MAKSFLAYTLVSFLHTSKYNKEHVIWVEVVLQPMKRLQAAF